MNEFISQRGVCRASPGFARVCLKELLPKLLKQSQIVLGGPTLPSLPNAITETGFCRQQSEHVKHEFRGILPATPPPDAPACAVTCRRRRKPPLDDATDLL